jgi:hypothetical protein
MFFYEGFATIGLPKPLMTWLRQGHWYGCDAPDAERRAIIDYLRAP